MRLNAETNVFAETQEVDGGIIYVATDAAGFSLPRVLKARNFHARV